MSLTTIESDALKNLIRDVPDFPKKGILFKDITTVLKDGAAFRSAVDAIASAHKGKGITRVVCIEARGFVLGSAVAYALGCGVVPVRKKGKLPCKTYGADYELEYGTDTLEIHCDAIEASDKILIVDDLLATGGTVSAVLALFKQFKARIGGLAFFVELDFLKGRQRLANYPVYSVVQF